MSSELKSLISKLKEQVDIVQVVGETVHLKRIGKNFRGLCPFHSEKTPSFYVHPATRHFFCYGCKENGDVIHFVQKSKGLGFKEAAAYLIQQHRLNLSLPGFQGSTQISAPARDRQKAWIRVQQFAAKFYASRLPKTPAAQTYLTHTRKLTSESLETFGLGASAWESRDSLYMALRSHIASSPLMETYMQGALQTGLLLSKQPQVEDRFFQRIMIPIRNLHGQVVGFGSRSLSSDKEVPKYLNSPESDLFHKRELLYGLYENLPEIRKRRELLLVEGFFDVIKLWQSGIRYAAASMGTALSGGWIRRLKRLVKRLVIVFDGDEPGIQAMVRHAPAFFQEGWEPEVMVIPQGEDPDSWIDKHGAESFLALSRESRRYLDFYFLHRLNHSSQSYFEVASLFEEVLGVLQKSCSYAVALPRMEQYLEIADLGFETRRSLLDHLKQGYGRPPPSKGRGGVKNPQWGVPDAGWLDEVRMLAICIYDLAFIEKLCDPSSPTPPFWPLKDKAICGVISHLNEYKSVLETIPESEDRIQFIQHSEGSTQASHKLFESLRKQFSEGLLRPQVSVQSLWDHLMQRAIRRVQTQERKLKLMGFRQKYREGRMSWDEVVRELETIQQSRHVGSEPSSGETE
jgi:DNA primase catalytic core